MYIYIEMTTSGGIRDRSPSVVDTDGEYRRLYCTVTLKSGQTVNVRLVNSGKQYAPFSGLQLQKGDAATSYNYLENGSFEKGFSGWSKTSACTSNVTELYDGAKSVKISGHAEEMHYVSQEINVNTSRATWETFKLSGWAKAYTPLNSSGDNQNAAFCLRARIYYSDGTWEDFDADFAKQIEGWQYVSISFAKTQYKIIDKICIYCLFRPWKRRLK